MMHRRRPAPPNGGKDGMHSETDLNELMQGGGKDGNANEPDTAKSGSRPQQKRKRRDPVAEGRTIILSRKELNHEKSNSKTSHIAHYALLVSAPFYFIIQKNHSGTK